MAKSAGKTVDRPNVLATVATLQEFVSTIQNQIGSASQFWYRGQGVQSYSLVPSLFRHPAIKGPDEVLKLEVQLLSRFQERSVPFLPSRLPSDLEYLFLMQHHGTPTRLLDWSESPLVALFFALESAIQKVPLVEPAVVWVLDTKEWNRVAFEHVSHDGSILSPGDDYLKSYLPRQTAASLPAAIFGIHNSSRIVAQRGVFILFGKPGLSMDQASKDPRWTTPVLQQIAVPPTAVPDLLAELARFGITDAVLFPDLEGLARETKRLFGFI